MPWSPHNPEGDENRTNAKEFNTVIKKLKGKKALDQTEYQMNLGD